MTMILWGRRQILFRCIHNTTRQKTNKNGTSCRVFAATTQPLPFLLPHQQHLTTSRNINTTATWATQSLSNGVITNNQKAHNKINNDHTRYPSSLILHNTNRHVTTTTTSSPPPPPIHPLTPLTASEILRTSETVKSHYSPNPIRFVAITLHEPHSPSPSTPRLAEVIVIHPLTGLCSTLLLDLSTDAVTSTQNLPRGTQPMFTPDDCDLAEEIVQNDPRMIEIMKERYGIEDMTRVACDPWSVNFGCETDESLAEWRKNEAGEDGDIPGRLVQTFLYHRQNGPSLEDNHYAHPIDILPVVDLHARRVVHVHGDLSSPPPPIPSTPSNYHRDLVGGNTYLPSTFREETLAPLHVVQPEGPSFEVNDDVVRWQKWSFRVGFNYREGLVLHDVTYDGRMVMRRGSLVEMAVPYGDPNEPFQRKCAFDVGDYGLGYCANSLELGCDCLGHIHYFDAVLSNAKGEPVEKKKVVCMHEEDAGILWKHVEYRNGHNETRRSRELIISFIATVVNYEYLFYWHLKQDGCIEFNIKLSGELSTNTLSPPERPSGRPSHGTIVTPDGVNAQIHQHMFCARLDMAVDGPRNTVSEVDIVPDDPDPIRNPYGNAFSARERTLATEKEAIRTIDPSRARTWTISSTSRINPITKKRTAYKLVPFARGPAQPTLLTSPSCRISHKGAFAAANLWVTPRVATERYPAGEYTVQGDGSEGLPSWTSRDRNIVGEELVLWHGFGVCHVPRTEDFPVMPVEVTGFVLKPEGFFEGNPGVDLRPEVDDWSELSNKECCGTT